MPNIFFNRGNRNFNRESLFLREFPTCARHPKVQIRKDSFHKQVVKGPGYVSGICWIFLRMIKHDETC